MSNMVQEPTVDLNRREKRGCATLIRSQPLQWWKMAVIGFSPMVSCCCAVMVSRTVFAKAIVHAFPSFEGVFFLAASWSL